LKKEQKARELLVYVVTDDEEVKGVLYESNKRKEETKAS
jgi:hypothetical protein